MAKKTKKELTELLKNTVEQKAETQKSGWNAEDSEKVALALVRVQTDADGKEVKLPPERIARITAAMQITPKRIVQLIKSELKAVDAEVDEVSEDLLMKVLDYPKFRTELEGLGMLEKTGKGGKKRKETLKELFAA